MWILLALASALFQVLRNAVMKRLGHSLDEYINVWGRFTFLLPFALVSVAANGWPAIQPGFVWICLLFGLCQNIAMLALSKALKLSEISLVTALWKVSLPILLVMGYLTLRETPTAIGVLGVVISAAGVYLLNVRRARISARDPLVVLFTDPGLRYTLLAAFFFAPSTLAFKQASLLSDPYTGTFGTYLAASLMVTPLVLVTSRRHFARVPGHWMEFVGLGLFAALNSVSLAIAYTLTLTSYVEAVKQVEVLFALGIGVLAFRESERVREILPGTLVMLGGLVLLGLAG